MAEALLAAALPAHRVVSAGLDAMVGHRADPIARELMAEQGLDVTAHRARQLTQEICDESDLILVMDDRQKRELLGRHPSARGKLYKLGEPEGFDVFDPYQLDRFEFERCLSLIQKGCATWQGRVNVIL